MVYLCGDLKETKFPHLENIGKAKKGEKEEMSFKFIV